MSTIYTIKESTLTAIGDAIREKTGTMVMLNPEGEMPEAIRGISAEFNIERIEIVTPPDIVTYRYGDFFNPSGMSVLVYYSDGSSAECLGYEYNTNPLTPNDNNFIISFTWRDATVTTVQHITVAAATANVYGVEWDGTATTKWSRTDDASEFVDPIPYVAGATEYSSPFDDLYPWKSVVNVTDPVVGELVAIPKFWYKWTQNGNALKLQIATEAFPEFHVSPAHADRGDGYGERDVVYVGRYLCGSDYKSISGVASATGMTMENARTNIANLGVGYYQYDLAMLWTIRMLYLVEYADWDLQRRIGVGGGSGNTGIGSSMPYHTGTPYSDTASVGKGIQYRYVEGLWGDNMQWVDGMWSNTGTSLYAKSNPNTFGDSANRTYIGEEPNRVIDVVPNKFNVCTVAGFEYVLLFAGVGGTDATYCTDNITIANNRTNTAVGGGGNHCYGPFSINRAQISTNYIGCRLMKLPNPS
jgi:hypothetical protein